MSANACPAVIAPPENVASRRTRRCMSRLRNTSQEFWMRLQADWIGRRHRDAAAAGQPALQPGVVSRRRLTMASSRAAKGCARLRRGSPGIWICPDFRKSASAGSPNSRTPAPVISHCHTSPRAGCRPRMLDLFDRRCAGAPVRISACRGMGVPGAIIEYGSGRPSTGPRVPPWPPLAAASRLPGRAVRCRRPRGRRVPKAFP